MRTYAVLYQRIRKYINCPKIMYLNFLTKMSNANNTDIGGICSGSTLPFQQVFCEITSHKKSGFREKRME